MDAIEVDRLKFYQVMVVVPGQTCVAFKSQYRHEAETKYTEIEATHRREGYGARVTLCEYHGARFIETIRDSHAEALTAPTGETYTDPETGEESRVPPGGWRRAQPGVYLHTSPR